MKTSTERLDFVMGRQKIRAADLEPQEWLALIKEVVGRAGPSFNDWTYEFEPLNKLLNHRGGVYLGLDVEYDRWETSALSLPPGITRETPCMNIDFLSRRPGIPERRFDVRAALEKGTGRYSIEQSVLLLTQTAMWLEWTAVGVLKLLPYHGEHHLSSDHEIVVVSESSQITYLLTDEDLQRVSHPKIGLAILQRLAFAAKNKEENAKRDFLAKKSLARTLQAIRSRFGNSYI